SADTSRVRATVAVELARPDEADATRQFVEIVNAVTPESPTSLEDIAWSDATYPGAVRFLGRLDGRVVGAASIGRIYMDEATFERHWTGLHGLPEARRRGLGTRLWTAASAVTRSAGKTGYQTDVSAAQTDGLAFLAHRGFAELERHKMVQLHLRDIPVPEV